MLESSSRSSKPVLIVGAGMAGLTCALRLQSAGYTVQIYEAGDGVGGRVRTDQVDGFLLDRGFQVYLDTYPETGKLLDLKALDLRPFEPGALVFCDGKLHRLMDVFRRPKSLWSSVRAPIGSLTDKMRVGALRLKILNRSFERIASRKDQSTEAYLKGFGFSDSIIDQFFRAFYGGIFLERDLRTSSRMFEFTFKLFGRGSATLPAAGMGAIPEQLAARLPEGAVHLNQPVREVDARTILLEDGREIEGLGVVVATDGTVAKKLLPELNIASPVWRSVTNLYFAADHSPIEAPIICLNGSGSGLINNVCVLTDAAPAYAPSGEALLSVSVLGLPNEDGLVDAVLEELSGWFSFETNTWRHLRTDRIERALPEQPPNHSTQGFIEHSGIYVCGDHLNTASIEGAVVSGQRAADAMIHRLKEAR
jgi:phytoene dehydrogenase-like protein